MFNMLSPERWLFSFCGLFARARLLQHTSRGAERYHVLPPKFVGEMRGDISSGTSCLASSQLE